jgi:hypothetical protein
MEVVVVVLRMALALLLPVEQAVEEIPMLLARQTQAEAEAQV